LPSIRRIAGFSLEMEKRKKEQEIALERIGGTVSLTSMTPKL
jgi:hypothetical protein